MAFPNIDLANIKTQLRNAFLIQGHTATVLLNDGVTTFNVQVTEGFRRASNLTEGLAQDTHRFKILYDEWEAESPGRAPQKGDQFTVLGQRYALQAAGRLRGLGDAGIMYVCEVRG